MIQRSLLTTLGVHRRGVWLAWAAAGVAAAGGCVDAESMQQAHHDDSHFVKMAEVDLGAYHITLPQATSEAGGGVVDFHAFGRVSRSDLEAVAKAVEERRPELRSRMLLALRSITAGELEEPTLSKLRAEIAAVINQALDYEEVKNVGFYRFSYTSL